jgi:hypothetical protein
VDVILAEGKAWADWISRENFWKLDVERALLYEYNDFYKTAESIRTTSSVCR